MEWGGINGIWRMEFSSRMVGRSLLLLQVSHHQSCEKIQNNNHSLIYALLFPSRTCTTNLIKWNCCNASTIRFSQVKWFVICEVLKCFVKLRGREGFAQIKWFVICEVLKCFVKLRGREGFAQIKWFVICEVLKWFVKLRGREGGIRTNQMIYYLWSSG